jgi:hypothetical protein
MRLPPLSQLLAGLAHAERATYRRATRVGSRFELAQSSLVLLELVCQTRASIDELEAFSDARAIAFEGLSAWFVGCVSALIQWMGALWPQTSQAVYGAIASASMRDVEIAARLRLAALRVGDHTLADWCVHWMAERLDLIDRLTVSLEAADAQEFSPLSMGAFQARR